MEKKAGKNIKEWLKMIYRMIFVALTLLQSGFALAWAVQNGLRIQGFADTAIYISYAYGAPSDGWRLYGYGVLLRWMQAICKDGYPLAVFIVQTLISVAVFSYVLKVCGKLVTGKKLAIWQAVLGGWYLCTIPTVWQMNFALLPDSVCTSLLFLLIAILIQVLGENERFRNYWLAAAVAIVILLGCTEYLYFYGAVAISFLFLWAEGIRLINVKGEHKNHLAPIFIFIGCMILAALIIPKINRVDGSRNAYVTYSISAKLMDRFVYPRLYEDYAFYPESVRALFTLEEAAQADEVMEYTRSRVGAQIEAEVGAKSAAKIYREMVYTGITARTTENIERLYKDTASHLLQPISMLKYMCRNHQSRYGYNYSRMWEESPMLCERYMHLGMVGVCVLFAIGLLQAVVILIRGKYRRRQVGLMAFCFMGFIAYTLIATVFSPGGADYRIGNPMMLCWLLLPVGTVVCFTLTEETENDSPT